MPLPSRPRPDTPAPLPHSLDQVIYGGYYSLVGEPNPWIEFYKYDAETGTATVTGNVDPWLTSITWCDQELVSCDVF
jgi:hypothetical protein